MKEQKISDKKTVTNGHKKQVTDLKDEVTYISRGLYVREKISSQTEEKREIGRHITKNYIKDFDAVLLDAGSTVEIIAEEMLSKRNFLSILTNNMGAYAAYTRSAKSSYHDNFGEENDLLTTDEKEIRTRHFIGNELHITGGRYVDIYEALLGQGAISTIKEFTPNVTIIGTSGLLFPEGAFCHGSEEAVVKELLWTKATDIRIVVSDWTKIGKRDAHLFGRFDLLAHDAKEVILVTCYPPETIGDEKLKVFEEQLMQIEKNTKVVVVKLKSPSVG